MEKPICNAPRGKAKTSHFARVVALVRQVATSATLPAVLALAGAASALTALGDGLPAEYQQLEFIQANGNCQIRTGITPTCTDKVEMTWRPATVSGNQNLFCSRTGTGATGQFTLFMIGDKVRFDRNTSTVTGANAISAATKYTVVADYATLAGTVTLADTGAEVTSVTMTSGDFIPGSELCLYASHTSDPNTGLNNYASYALYSFKLSDSSDNLKLDLVPAKRKADGVIGLYDAVNDAFLTNYLSGTFLAGPAVLTFNSYTWNGGASGNLSDAANWSPAPAGAFTADDELVVNDAACRRNSRQAHPQRGGSRRVHGRERPHGHPNRQHGHGRGYVQLPRQLLRHVLRGADGRSEVPRRCDGYVPRCHVAHSVHA